MSGGCAVNDPSFEGGLVIPENGVDTDVTFALEAFIWPDGTTTAYFHCMVEICDSSTSNCVPSCGAGRKKRATVTAPHDPMRYVSINSVGPVSMQMPESCEDNHCSDMCKSTWGYNSITRRFQQTPKCSCKPGYEWKNDAQYRCQLRKDLIPAEGQITVSDRKTASAYTQWKASQKSKGWKYFSGSRQKSLGHTQANGWF